MSASPDAWRLTSQLDGLRPDPDWTVELALLATYSAQPLSIVAALLALVGRDDEDRPPARRDLADAIEAMRGKLRIVVQRGRFTRMPRTSRLTGVLDQFVRDVAFDEREQSWHPKAALVRLSRGVEVEWRLWVGSRNLTTSENRDLGLLLVSGPARRGRVAPGAGDIAAALATRADLPGVDPARLAAEVGKLKWRAPAGIQVDRLRISRGDAEWSLPDLPGTVDALTVVSPFLDARFLRHVGGTRCREGRPRLLSTRFEIERIAKTCAAFGELLALDAPDYPPASSDRHTVPGDIDAPGEGEDIGRGLHAKLLHVRDGRLRRFWMGSANATRRGWTGRNVEIIAELTVDERVEQGLLKLLDGAALVDLSDLGPLVDDEPTRSPLETARLEVTANWRGEIHWDLDGLRLRQTPGPHPSDPEIRLEAGLITGDLIPWPVGQAEIDLGVVAEADLTELVQLRLTLGEETCDWMLQAPANPPFGAERDRAAFMRLMGAREFLLWIADALRGVTTVADGPDWTEEPQEPATRTASSASWSDGLPTQEEILGVWARSPETYAAVRRRVATFLPALLEHTRTTDPQGHRDLEGFARMFAVLDEGLGVAS